MALPTIEAGLAEPGYYWRQDADVKDWDIIFLDEEGEWWFGNVPLYLSAPEHDEILHGPIVPPTICEVL